MAGLQPWSTDAFSSPLEGLQWPSPWQKWPLCTQDHVCNPTVTNVDVVQRPSDWCAVSMVCQFRTFCTEVLGLDSRYQPAIALIALTRMLIRGLGWLTVSAWTLGCAGTPAVIANNIIGLVRFNYEDYQPKAWHTTLTMWGLILVPVLFNLWFRQVLNAFELLGGIFHFIFFIASIVTLVVLARRSTPDFVFNTLTTGQSGWTNPGVSWGIGLTTLTFAISGAQWHPPVPHFPVIDKV